MRIDYEIENDFGRVKTLSYEADDKEVEDVIKQELESMSKEQLIELLTEVIGCGELKDYFEEEIQDAFRDDAISSFYED